MPLSQRVEFVTFLAGYTANDLETILDYTDAARDENSRSWAKDQILLVYAKDAERWPEGESMEQELDIDEWKKEEVALDEYDEELESYFYKLGEPGNFLEIVEVDQASSLYKKAEVRRFPPPNMTYTQKRNWKKRRPREEARGQRLYQAIIKDQHGDKELPKGLYYMDSNTAKMVSSRDYISSDPAESSDSEEAFALDQPGTSARTVPPNPSLDSHGSAGCHSIPSEDSTYDSEDELKELYKRRKVISSSDDDEF